VNSRRSSNYAKERTLAHRITIRARLGALAANARQTGGPFVEPSDHPSVTQQQLVTEGQAKRRDFIALLGGAAASRSGRTDNRGEESWSA
jgi:hypothetical protein